MSSAAAVPSSAAPSSTPLSPRASRPPKPRSQPRVRIAPVKPPIKKNQTNNVTNKNGNNEREQASKHDAPAAEPSPSVPSVSVSSVPSRPVRMPQRHRQQNDKIPNNQEQEQKSEPKPIESGNNEPSTAPASASASVSSSVVASSSPAVPAPRSAAPVRRPPKSARPIEPAPEPVKVATPEPAKEPSPAAEPVPVVPSEPMKTFVAPPPPPSAPLSSNAPFKPSKPPKLLKSQEALALLKEEAEKIEQLNRELAKQGIQNAQEEKIAEKTEEPTTLEMEKNVEIRAEPKLPVLKEIQPLLAIISDSAPSKNAFPRRGEAKRHPEGGANQQPREAANAEAAMKDVRGDRVKVVSAGNQSAPGQSSGAGLQGAGEVVQTALLTPVTVQHQHQHQHQHQQHVPQPQFREPVQDPSQAHFPPVQYHPPQMNFNAPPPQVQQHQQQHQNQSFPPGYHGGHQQRFAEQERQFQQSQQQQQAEQSEYHAESEHSQEFTPHSQPQPQPQPQQSQQQQPQSQQPHSQPAQRMTIELRGMQPINPGQMHGGPHGHPTHEEPKGYMSASFPYGNQPPSIPFIGPGGGDRRPPGYSMPAFSQPPRVFDPFQGRSQFPMPPGQPQFMPAPAGLPQNFNMNSLPPRPAPMEFAGLPQNQFALPIPPGYGQQPFQWPFPPVDSQLPPPPPANFPPQIPYFGTPEQQINFFQRPAPGFPYLPNPPQSQQQPNSNPIIRIHSPPLPLSLNPSPMANSQPDSIQSSPEMPANRLIPQIPLPPGMSPNAQSPYLEDYVPIPVEAYHQQQFQQQEMEAAQHQ